MAWEEKQQWVLQTKQFLQAHPERCTCPHIIKDVRASDFDADVWDRHQGSDACVARFLGLDPRRVSEFLKKTKQGFQPNTPEPTTSLTNPAPAAIHAENGSDISPIQDEPPATAGVKKTGGEAKTPISAGGAGMSPETLTALQDSLKEDEQALKSDKPVTKGGRDPHNPVVIATKLAEGAKSQVVAALIRSLAATRSTYGKKFGELNGSCEPRDRLLLAQELKATAALFEAKAQQL
jgi:hypothetical protein